MYTQVKDVRIAISGPNAAGVTSVTELVAQKLNLKPVTYTFADMAKELGTTREELDKRKATEFPKLDYQLDKRNVEQATDGTVFGSDISVWLVEADLRVWLHAPWRVRAERLAGRENMPSAEAAKRIKERDAFYVAHYRKLYGINWRKPEDQVHLVLNTATMDKETVAEVISTAARNAPFKADPKARRRIRKIHKLIGL